MPYIIILKVRRFHQPTANCSSTAKQKPVGRGYNVPPSLNRVNDFTGHLGEFGKAKTLSQSAGI